MMLRGKIRGLVFLSNKVTESLSLSCGLIS